MVKMVVFLVVAITQFAGTLKMPVSDVAVA
jgi:hypothetical protein